MGSREEMERRVEDGCYGVIYHYYRVIVIRQDYEIAHEHSSQKQA